MKIQQLKLFVISVLLTGCLNDHNDTKEKVDAYLIDKQQQDTAYPETTPTNNTLLEVAETANTTPQNSKSIYKCTLANGKKVFSDQHCNQHEETIAIDQLRPNVATAYHQPSQQTHRIPTVSTNITNNNNADQPASAYEINTRYDNLAREIKSLFRENDKMQLNHLLIRLEQDRNQALTMKMRSIQSYEINNRFDNLETDIRAKQKGGARAVELLKVENLRNQALYHY